MKHILRIVAIFLLPFVAAEAQEKAAGLYNPAADAAADLEKAIQTASAEHKHVLAQVGGNWCSWCLKLDKLFRSDERIDSVMHEAYVLVHLNYSKENMNLPVLARLGYPQRFGFPVLVVLDGGGTRLHTQDSGLLEDGKGHSPEKVLTFLMNWAPSALDSSKYTAR